MNGKNMKTTKMLVLIAFLLLSCSTDEINEDDHRDAVYYSYTAKSRLTISSPEQQYMNYGLIEEGENLVFEYQFIAYDEEQIADDEYAETILIEIDSSLESFAYADDELATLPIVFTQYCYCYFPMDESKNVPPKGTIQGEKRANDEWHLTIDVTFYGDAHRTVEGIFTLK